MEKIRRIFEEKGLTEKQIEAGVKYYENFGKHFWPLKNVGFEVPKAPKGAEGGIPWLTTRKEYR